MKITVGDRPKELKSFFYEVPEGYVYSFKRIVRNGIEDINPPTTEILKAGERYVYYFSLL